MSIVAPDVDRMNDITRVGRFMESACSTDTFSSYNISRCLWAGRTEICDVVIAESPVYGKILFLDNELQSSEADEAIYHEHLVHPVLNATASVLRKSVLIVGGGEGATAREVLKWDSNLVSNVDWVDIDGTLVNLCRRYMCFAEDSVYNDPRLNYFAEDIRAFWARVDTKYDVIILDLPDPDVRALEAGDERELYNKEFMETVKLHLNSGGAVVSHVGPIAPGPVKNREGLNWMETVSTAIGKGHAYHVTIPSFQGEWGFWMSVASNNSDQFPHGLAVMDIDAQKYAFTWPRYWTLAHSARGHIENN